jgi:dihydroflavonol-4-reductase
MTTDRPILVTGGTGLLGNNIIRTLVDRGMPVRALMRASSDPRTIEGLKVDTVPGDVSDAESIKKAMEGVACVIHSAGYVQIGRGRWDLHQAINIDGSRYVAQAAREARVRMVHVSSCDAIGIASLDEPATEDTPLKPPVDCNYVKSKQAAERGVMAEVEKGLDAVIVNPGFMLGPWDWKPSSGRMLVAVIKGVARVAPNGHFSLCDARDVAAGVVTAIEKGRAGERYILAGHTLSYYEAWDAFARVTQSGRPLFTAPKMLESMAGCFGDLIRIITRREPDVNTGAIAVARLPKHYSSDKAIRELDYHIRPIDEMIHDAWQWFMDHGYVKRRS